MSIYPQRSNTNGYHDDTITVPKGITMDVDKTKVDRFVPLKEQRRLRNARIKSLYRKGMSMDDICRALSVSKTTVFFAIKKPKKKTSNLKK